MKFTIFLVLAHLTTCVPLVHAVHYKPKLVVNLYDSKGLKIDTRTSYGFSRLSFGAVKCDFTYHPASRQYQMKCKNSYTNGVLHQASTSCRVQDTKVLSFTVSEKGETGVRRYFFKWYCKGYQEI